jgi:hypothetical protein
LCVLSVASWVVLESRNDTDNCGGSGRVRVKHMLRLQGQEWSRVRDKGSGVRVRVLFLFLIGRKDMSFVHI